ncbi:glycosyltransferase [Pseudoalteromonas sp. SMS1]|uniref:glycosyltransferase n=1 Tax=Pseudoalteromonas sp. SMS1 TaxID=2908894 RepID=UPI001F42D8D6|nr:glycosyltransferase [Pseudoalteromonas sp. SMS1]MCF2857426.1 glycosyltransferase [Pseudoalteromonas sp. SMS1]
MSQVELWKTFSKQSNVVICGSFLSYFIYGRNSKYVVSLEPKYNAPCFISYSKNHKKVIAFISDSHSKKWLNQFLLKSNVSDVLTPYKKTLIETGFVSNLSEANIHSFPWCVNDSIVSSETPTVRRKDVLGFGKTGTEVYDLRQWSFETGELVSFDYAGSGNQKFTGNAYYNWLSTFDACVVGMSSIALYNYTVAKFFEVPSQGILLFAFPTVDIEAFGFEDGVNCVFVNKDDFHEKLRAFKEQPELYIDIRKKGLKLIRDHHTVRNRLEQLNDLIAPESI